MHSITDAFYLIVCVYSVRLIRAYRCIVLWVEEYACDGQENMHETAGRKSDDSDIERDT